MKPGAKWIWANRERVRDYNQTAIFRRDFDLSEWQRAKIMITADSWYRLKVNGHWVNDGPCRSYPNHYQYDEINLAGLLREGRNRIEVVVRYFGSGTAHQLPQQAGFLAQLEILSATGPPLIIGTDSQWLAADFSAMVPNTPRLSIKQEPAELYDARRKEGELRPAEEFFAAGEGPWTGLHPRDCRLLTRSEVNLRRFVSAGRIQSTVWNLSIPAQKLLHPGLATTNFSTSLACGAAFRVESSVDSEFEFLAENLDIFINGECINPSPDLSQHCRGSFRQGENLLLVLSKFPFENQTDLCVTIIDPHGLDIRNPVEPDSDRICFLEFPEFHWESCEIPFHMWANRELHRRQREATEYLVALGSRVRSCADLATVAGRNLRQLDPDCFSDDLAHWEFCARKIGPLLPGDVEAPENLLYDTCEWTRLRPVPGPGLELIYDFGEQGCGYWEFELIAPEGTVIDLFAVEHMTRKGRVQHTDDVRNGLRYTCREGLNRFISYRRRSGRYLFLAFRNLTGPVEVKYVRLLTSTYPVNQQGTFLCSDETLNRIWGLCARTIRLCMEDVFTDCPCYEQSLWLGDGRNIALFSFPLYAPWDLARRCIRLGGHSLDRYPIAGSQVPSGWDCLIPAWSFLWGVAVWDYYEETADIEFIKEVLPMVRKNIEGGLARLDPENGLFTMYAWNLFEWVGTDTHQPRMLYDSMLLAAALQAAIRCEEVAGNQTGHFRNSLAALTSAINRTWLKDRQAYPDSLRKEGDFTPANLPANLAPCNAGEKYSGPCREISVHTSMLAILFDIVEAGNFAAAVENVLNPRPDLIRVNNMFARFYLYQCMEKLGRDAEILPHLRQDYQPMLEVDATTAWESFLTFREHFPCRSHCHGWSAGAIHFLYRLVLGLKPSQPGGVEFILSPEIGDMTFAEGIRATIKGAIGVRWERQGDRLVIDTSAPPGVSLIFQRNASHGDLIVVWNGQIQSRVFAESNLGRDRKDGRGNTTSPKRCLSE